ncbi:hypothetical protein [Haloterrigena salinisoli]|uniref:hypothetical protein n=1 Tax=Haloterrigena salinisoli TaxID=3132747 RepID=UPI0030D43DA7
MQVVNALDEPPAILRGARNIDGLSEAALNDPETLRTTFAEWGEMLEELTTKLSRATGDDTSPLGAEIMRSSHGLAGSIIHLLDATGIDVVCDVRVPSSCESADLEGLAESITRSALIQSKYGVFAPYHHILETDAGEPSLSPTVDAADPHGELIRSFVFRGPDVHRIRDPLEMRLSSPGDVLEDAPEITVPITVTDAGRPEIATTVTRLLEDNNLRPTREAVSVLHALTGSPFDVAHAVNQLESEATSLSISAAIQGKYGVFASYRQLFESREEKRRTALTPTVDADNPLGTLIGSVVVRREDVHPLHPSLEEALERPAAVADDAPEFAVHAPLSMVDRTGYAATTMRILESKNLRPTRDSISLLQAVVSSPYAAA